jgi:hypothetical protein
MATTTSAAAAATSSPGGIVTNAGIAPLSKSAIAWLSICIFLAVATLAGVVWLICSGTCCFSRKRRKDSLSLYDNRNDYWLWNPTVPVHEDGNGIELRGLTSAAAAPAGYEGMGARRDSQVSPNAVHLAEPQPAHVAV